MGKEKSADPAELAAGIKASTARTVEAPAVSKVPATSVEVVTETVSPTAGEPVTLPSSADLATQLENKMAQKTGKNFTAVVSNVGVTELSSTTSSNDVSELGGASELSADGIQILAAILALTSASV